MPLQTIFGSGRALLAWIAGAAVVGGAVGVALGSTGAVEIIDTSPAARNAAPYHRCPGGELVGYRYAGDRVFATGRSADGDWIQVRSPDDISSRVWLKVETLEPDDSLDGLPERECAEQNPTLVEPTFSPDPGAARKKSRPRASPSPGEEPEEEPGGDAAGPSIAAITVNPRDIYEHFSNAGPCDFQNVSTIRAHVSDADGVRSVTLRWSVGGESGSEAMSASGSTYSGNVGPYEADTVSSTSNIRIRIVAVDEEGNRAAASTTVRLHDHTECGPD